MELRVHLKVCEACGCLWFRAQAETGVYCSACYLRFKDFPTVESRRRRGRPKKTTLPAVFAVEDSNQWLGGEMELPQAQGGQHSSAGMRKPPQPVPGADDSLLALVAAHACYSANTIAGAL